MTSRRALVVLAVLLGVLAACGDDGSDGAGYGPDREIVVEDVTIVEPAGANSAVYLTLRNEGPDADRLVEVRSDDAARTELHETRADDDGLMRMHEVEAVDLPAGSTVHLEIGRAHV